MADDSNELHDVATGSADPTGHQPGEIHLPPNSVIPACLALALAITFVGFLISIAVWLPGLVLVVVCLAAWGRSAVSEYRELREL